MSVIEHQATVTAVSGKTVTVEITSRQACEACHLKDGCNLSEGKNKTLQIYAPSSGRCRPGQKVTVYIEERSGWLAVFFAYILPLLLVLTALTAVWIFTDSETAAAVCGLAILVPYYLVLILFRKNFDRRFSFKIRE